MVYSKNSKRKYDLIPQINEYHNLDFYFRYMKALTGSMKSLEIDFTGYSEIEGYWNKELLEQNPSTKKVFALYTVLGNSNDMFDLIENCALNKDPFIKKSEVISLNKKKHLKKHRIFKSSYAFNRLAKCGIRKNEQLNAKKKIIAEKNY